MFFNFFKLQHLLIQFLFNYQLIHLIADSLHLNHMCCWHYMELRPTMRRYKPLIIIILIALLIIIVHKISRYSLEVGQGAEALSKRELAWSDALSNRPGNRFGIVFDAGSTGSRIHVFEFRYDASSPQRYILLNETFEQVKPGLSAYANRPKEAALSLEPLLKVARRVIPISEMSWTPMALRATAGLRMLAELEAQRILTEITHHLQKSPFHLVHNGVTIMNGLDEGVFSWITLNFLTNRLPSSAPSAQPTIGALDLGGGSTQITYIPGEINEQIGERPLSKVYLHSVKLAGSSSVQLYTHSYLGLGLMAARFSLLSDPHKHPTEVLRSPCLPLNYTGRYDYNGKSYEIRADHSEQRLDLFTACYDTAKDLVTEHFYVDHPLDLNRKPFYAFSYYYDRAVDLQLIPPKQSGQLTLKDFFLKAQQVCNQPGNSRQPFLCMDLSYICALLHDGFRFHKSTAFQLGNKINQVELTWAIGAMFDVFYKYDLMR